ncbi:MAG: hypothetical protein ACKOX3_09815 [Bacteroidota bacterium]
METKRKEWDHILEGCSIKEAKVILVMQYLLYAFSSKLFFFSYLLIINVAITFYYYDYEKSSSFIFIGAFLLHCCIYTITNKILLEESDLEKEEIEYGIEAIRSYIDKRK